MKFKSFEGVELDGQFERSLSSTAEELNDIINKILENEEKLPYSFSFENFEVPFNYPLHLNIILDQTISERALKKVQKNH